MKYRIEMPAGKKLINVNDKELRKNYLLRNSLTASLRDTSEQIAREMKIPPQDKVRVRAFYYYPDNHVRDPGNYAPSVKAMIDGIRLAGVIPNDNDKYLTDDGILRGYPNVPGGQLVLVVTPYEESILTVIERLESWGIPYAVIQI